MYSKTRVDRPLDPAPRAIVQESILETIERGPCYAEGISDVDPELRHEMVATAAYYLAEQRGFAPGHEAEDWRRAEAAVEKELPRVLIRD